jgi:peptide-methionine (S)-S-oxide reductase
MPAREVATLAGGCFWCLEAVFADLRGVGTVESGYAGGHVESPSYEQVCTGTTGHAEVVHVTFDSEAISYRELLEIFFAIHDPTTPDQQGDDVGTQYRSVIFVHSDAQRKIAQEVIGELERDGPWDAPVVTEVTPFEGFYPAEDQHREYYARNPDQAYCRVIIAPKLAKFRARFAERLRGADAE